MYVSESIAIRSIFISLILFSFWIYWYTFIHTFFYNCEMDVSNGKAGGAFTIRRLIRWLLMSQTKNGPTVSKGCLSIEPSVRYSRPFDYTDRRADPRSHERIRTRFCAFSVDNVDLRVIDDGVAIKLAKYKTKNFVIIGSARNFGPKLGRYNQERRCSKVR